MEHVEKVVAQLDEYANMMPELVKVCKKYNIRPGQVLGAGGILVTILLILTKGYDVICALLTVVYPMISSIRAIESKDENDDKTWLCFWTVFGIFQTMELFFGFILNFIPYYSWVRLAFFIFLMAPQTNGAHTLYVKYFAPFLIEHKDQIRGFVDKVKSGASDAASQAMKEAKNAAKEQMNPENMMKAAAAAQKVQESLNDDDSSVNPVPVDERKME